jgi:hypothetical protein
MPTSLRSEKIHSANKESCSVDVILSIPGDEHAPPIRPADPKVLKRATLKIDFYLIPIIGMFCELSLLSPYLSLISPIIRSFVVSSEYSCNLSPSKVRTAP